MAKIDNEGRIAINVKALFDTYDEKTPDTELSVEATGGTYMLKKDPTRTACMDGDTCYLHAPSGPDISIFNSEEHVFFSLSEKEFETATSIPAADAKTWFEGWDKFALPADYPRFDSFADLHDWLQRHGDGHRDLLTYRDEAIFVQGCYDCYAKETYLKKITPSGGDLAEFQHRPFEVVGPIALDDPGYDAEVLPMWKIRMLDGEHEETAVYAEELFECERKH